MAAPPTPNVIRFVQAWCNGNPAALHRVVPLVSGEPEADPVPLDEALTKFFLLRELRRVEPAG